MTNSEFAVWFEHHTAAFPNIGEWMTGLPDTQRTIAHWRRCLDGVTLDEAKAATDEMFESEEHQPRGYAQHAPRIRKLAVDSRPDQGAQRDAKRYIGNELVCDCRLCKDSGYVTVWHVKTILEILEGRPLEWPRDENGRVLRSTEVPKSEWPVKKNSMVVFCTCRRGENARDLNRANAPSYHPEKHAINDGSNASFDEAVRRSEEIARNYNGMAREMANFDASFDEFNNT